MRRRARLACLFAAALVCAAPAASTAPPPMPPMPPENPAFLAGPDPVLTTTGDPKVDAFRDSLLRMETGGTMWRSYLTRLLAGVRADPAIITEFDRLAAIREPGDYVRYYVTPQRIRRGRQLYRQMKGAAKPGEMPPEVRLALWGMLADYGARKPRYDALQALLMLGAYGRAQPGYSFPIPTPRH